MLKEALIRNQSITRLGLASTGITCEGTRCPLSYFIQLLSIPWASLLVIPAWRARQNLWRVHFRCRGVGRVPGRVSVSPDSGCEAEPRPHWRPDGFRSGPEAQRHARSFRPGPKPQREEGEGMVNASCYVTITNILSHRMKLWL